MKTIVTLVFTVLFFTVSQGQNQNISEGSVFDGEPYLAVNPANSENIVIAWMGYLPYNYIVIKTRASFDGGQTWSAVGYIPHIAGMTQSADPSLVFDNNGNLFLSYVDYDQPSETGAIYVRKSTDGGLTWGAPAEVINASSDIQCPVDRPWISIDNSGGIYNGNIYVTSMPPRIFGYLPPPYHPYFIKSVDGGQTFEPWRYLDTTNWLTGSYIRQPMPVNCVSGDGTFYAVYPSYVYSQNPLPQFIIASSSDAGNSFDYHTVFASSEVVSDTLAKNSYLILSNPSDYKHLAFIFLGVKYGDIDVFLKESFDRGITWSEEIRLNDDETGNNIMQDLLWADFDTDGDLVALWRDRRNGSDTTYETASEIWGTFRKNREPEFVNNFKISDTIVAYDTVLASSGNDFMCVKLRNDTLNAVWGDTRNGKLNIWFQQIGIDGSILSVKELADTENYDVVVYPNPFDEKLTVTGTDIEQIKIYDSAGKIVYFSRYAGENTYIIDTENFSQGVFFMEIKERSNIKTEKIVKYQRIRK